MSDTTRTDKAIRSYIEGRFCGFQYIDPDFARELERELNAQTNCMIISNGQALACSEQVEKAYEEVKCCASTLFLALDMSPHSCQASEHELECLTRDALNAYKKLIFD